MKKVVSVFIVSMLAGLFGLSAASASEVDVLLQKLVEKGYLNASEAQEVRSETNEQATKEDKQKQEDYKELAKSSMPDWVKNTKLKGDFRLRYQYDHIKTLASSAGTTTTNDRNQARIRLRIGLESKVNDKILVGIGLATGLTTDSSTNVTNKDTSRSPNVTLGQGFGKKPIGLDYAFVQYTAAPWATVIGGRFKNPLWEPGDLIWDTDINPEGGAVKFTKKLNPQTELFLTPGALIIDEYSDEGEDAFMAVLQAGITAQLTDTITFKGAVSYYDSANVKNKTLDGTTGTNSNTTNSASGKLLHGYKDITPAIELAFKDPFKKLGVTVPYLALFGEYVQNVDSSVTHDNTGYMFGFKYGKEKIEKWGDWQIKYNYAMLEKDSILDILPDSDRYGGKTGMRAHEAILSYGLGKNTWLEFDGYYGWQLKGNFGSTQSKPASVLQVDWNVKF